MSILPNPGHVQVVAKVVFNSELVSNHQRYDWCALTFSLWQIHHRIGSKEVRMHESTKICGTQNVPHFINDVTFYNTKLNIYFFRQCFCFLFVHCVAVLVTLCVFLEQFFILPAMSTISHTGLINYFIVLRRMRKNA